MLIIVNILYFKREIKNKRYNYLHSYLNVRGCILSTKNIFHNLKLHLKYAIFSMVWEEDPEWSNRLESCMGRIIPDPKPTHFNAKPTQTRNVRESIHIQLWTSTFISPIPILSFI